ncbi:hypothetical protein FA13DRAFT_1814658 [Coprinellus micaceus]|uniref:G domain-containing protein n=1 Tax=Coprinellus micaceus TaxID=71717 RepID=A0A4Y7T8G0_COPMI|nr:hypothetical protein FA13DRAFT_1814658 [Coprinellus micaceus]
MGDAPILNPRETDVVIPILGATGAGKSSFVNRLLESIGHLERAEVGENLTSCTDRLGVYTVELSGGVRVIVLDTPGFDDGIESDMKILKDVVGWLRKVYGRNSASALGGVIYVHDISQDRLSGSSSRTNMHIQMLNKECGLSLDKVTFVTSKWSQGLPDEVLEGREEELIRMYWNKMVRPEGARLRRLRVGAEAPCALEVVKSIVQDVKAERARRAERAAPHTKVFVGLRKKVSTIFSDASTIMHRPSQKAPPATEPDVRVIITTVGVLGVGGETTTVDEGIQKKLEKLEKRLFKRVLELLARV